MKTSSNIIVGICLIILLITLFYKKYTLKALEKFTDDQINGYSIDFSSSSPIFSSGQFSLIDNANIQSKITEFYGNSISKKTLIDPPKFLKSSIELLNSNSSSSPVNLKVIDSINGTTKQLIGFQPYILLTIANDGSNKYGFYTTIAFKNIQIDGSGNFIGTIIEGGKDGNYYGTFNRDLIKSPASDKYILIGPLTDIPAYDSSSTELSLRSFKVDATTLGQSVSSSPATTLPPDSRNSDGSSRFGNNNNVNVMDVLKQLKAKQLSSISATPNSIIDLGTHSLADCMRIAQWKKDDLGDTEQAYFSYEPINGDESGKCNFINLQGYNGLTNENSGQIYVYPLPDRDFRCVNEAGETLACDQVLARRLIENEEKEKLNEIENINKKLFDLQIDKLRVAEPSRILSYDEAVQQFYQNRLNSLTTYQTESQDKLTNKNQEMQQASNMQARYLISFKKQKEQELSKIRNQFKELNQLNADINRSTKLVNEERSRTLYIDSVHNLLIIVFAVLIIIGFLMVIYYNNKYSGAISNFVNNTKNKIFNLGNKPPAYNSNFNLPKPSAPPMNTNDLGNLF